MASWEALRAHLKETFDVGVDDGKLFAIDVRYEDGRHQRVFADVETVYGKRFLQLRSLVAKQQRIDPVEALEASAELTLGALVLEDGMYFLQQRIVLENLPIEGAEFVVRTVATIADNLESAHSGGKDMF